MAKNPIFPLYYNDILGSCKTWSDEEFGAYMRLLIEQWDNFGLPLGFDRLNRIAPSTQKNWELLKNKFIEVNGKLINQKLEQIREERTKYFEKQASNGKKGGRPITQTKPKLNPEINPNYNPKETIHNEDEYEDEIDKEDEIELIPTFNQFWNLYDKKVGDKEKLIRKWEKLSKNDKFEIMQYVPAYKKAQPDKKYRKNPETFLNNKSWKDELITSTPERKGIDRATGAMETLIAKKMGGFSSNTSTSD